MHFLLRAEVSFLQVVLAGVMTRESHRQECPLAVQRCVGLPGALWGQLTEVILFLISCEIFPQVTQKYV